MKVFQQKFQTMAFFNTFNANVICFFDEIQNTVKLLSRLTFFIHGKYMPKGLRPTGWDV